LIEKFIEKNFQKIQKIKLAELLIGQNFHDSENNVLFIALFSKYDFKNLIKTKEKELIKIN